MTKKRKRDEILKCYNNINDGKSPSWGCNGQLENHNVLAQSSEFIDEFRACSIHGNFYKIRITRVIDKRNQENAPGAPWVFSLHQDPSTSMHQQIPLPPLGTVPQVSTGVPVRLRYVAEVPKYSSSYPRLVG